MGRILSAVIVAVAWSEIAAQEPRTALVSIPTTQRQGSFQSGTFDVPGDATGVVRLVADIPSDAEYADPANSLWIRIYYFDTATSTWRVTASAKWVGGEHVDPDLGVNPRPYVAIRIEPFQGKSVRVEVDMPTRIRVGATLDIGPNWP